MPTDLESNEQRAQLGKRLCREFKACCSGVDSVDLRLAGQLRRQFAHVLGTFDEQPPQAHVTDAISCILHTLETQGDDWRQHAHVALQVGGSRPDHLVDDLIHCLLSTLPEEDRLPVVLSAVRNFRGEVLDPSGCLVGVATADELVEELDIRVSEAKRRVAVVELPASSPLVARAA
jgi:hypothetical protein